MEVMGYDKLFLLQNDESVDPKIKGYGKLWVTRGIGQEVQL